MPTGRLEYRPIDAIPRLGVPTPCHPQGMGRRDGFVLTVLAAAVSLALVSGCSRPLAPGDPDPVTATSTPRAPDFTPAAPSTHVEPGAQSLPWTLLGMSQDRKVL